MKASVVYLIAIVLANLTIAHFGPVATIYVAFFLIGLDLSLRDQLHDQWRGNHLVLKMGLLIAAGGLLSFALNAGAGQIAIASTVAFMAAASADALVYHMFRNRPWYQRVNASNVVGAGVDSALFPTIAFGALLPAIVLGQFAAKVLGGLLWSAIINQFRDRSAVEAA